MPSSLPPEPRLFLVSVGVSVLTNHEAQSERSLREAAQDLSSHFPQTPTPREALHEPSAGQQDVEDRLFDVLRRAGSEGHSAELDTLLLGENPLSSRDTVHLVIPETFEAIVAARVLKRYLENRVGAGVQHHLIRGLQMGNSDRLQGQGLPNLVITASTIIEQAGDRSTYITATAGFKPVSIFLTLVGLIHQTPVLYYAQDEGPPLKLPGIQLIPDTDLWKTYYRVFNSFRREKEVPQARLRKWLGDKWPTELEPYLIREDQEARLSALGTLLQRKAEAVFRDTLTGACNREFLDHLLSDPHDLTEAHQEIGFLYMDIDHFKEVNDTYGHDVGDQLLKHVARTITTVLEADDELRYLIRYGGEEFLAVLPDHTRLEARTLAEDILSRVRGASIQTNGDALGATLTIGIASWPQEAANVEEVIDLADRRLLEGKEAGRDRIVDE